MKRFRSSFAAEIESFLRFKRTLGRSYRRPEFTLRSFDRFVADHAPRALDIGEIVRAFLARCPQRRAVTTSQEFGVIRQFFLHRRRRHPDGFVPDRSWAPWGAGSLFKPHIFTIEEIRQVLSAVSRPDAAPPMEPGFRCLFLVLYCTGLRFGEVVRLRVRDVDLDQRVLHVIESKGKSRLIPFRTDLGQELRRYREECHAPTLAGPGVPFFVRGDGREYSVRRVSDILRAVLRRLRLKPPAGRVGPRPYDVRHAFAVHRLSRWYREGINVPSQLPWLSAYMGHEDLLGTETYLTATPEILELSSRRLRRRLHIEEDTP